MPVGPGLLPGQGDQVRIAARGGAEAIAPNAHVRANGAHCSPRGEIAMLPGFQEAMPYWDPPAEGIRPYKMHGYDVPEVALHRGDNVIEMGNQDPHEIALIGAEIATRDESGSPQPDPIGAGRGCDSETARG